MKKVVVSLSCVLLVFGSQLLHAEQVGINFTVTADTVTGTPFGIDQSLILNEVFTGHMLYDTATADTTPADMNVGTYPHSAGGGFSISLLGTAIGGSSTPYVEVKNDFFGADTFLYRDGGSTGTMTVDGVPDSTVLLSLNIQEGTASTINNDSLPNPFSFVVPFNHTFSLRDSGGLILFQVNEVHPVPEPSSIALLACGLVAGGMFLRSRR